MRRWAWLGLLIAAPGLAQPPDPQATIVLYERLYRESGNASLLWLLAEAHAAQNDRAAAVAALERVAAAGIGFSVAPDSGLTRFAGQADYDRIAARLAAAAPIVRRGRQIAQIADMNSLVPEGIAADPASGRLFLGDMHNRRILAIDRQGQVRPFGAPLAMRPLGMKVDIARGLLWIATTDAFWASQPVGVQLVALDLATGAMRRSVGGPARSLNDLVIASDGTIYVTDSLAGAVFRLDPGADTLVRIAPDAVMSYPNGIALSGDGSALYVAQGISLRRIDLASGAAGTVAHPSNLALLAIDGLYWYRGRLIAVQNGGGPGRILALDLSPDGRSIVGHQVLEAGDPGFNLPTTGAVIDGRLIFIANSQLRRIGDDGRLTEGRAVAPIRLIELALLP